MEELGPNDTSSKKELLGEQPEVVVLISKEAPRKMKVVVGEGLLQEPVEEAD